MRMDNSLSVSNNRLELHPANAETTRGLGQQRHSHWDGSCDRGRLRTDARQLAASAAVRAIRKAPASLATRR